MPRVRERRTALSRCVVWRGRTCCPPSPGRAAPHPRARLQGGARWRRSRCPTTITNGKICYLEIPAADIARSAEFYRSAFGWGMRTSGHGRTAFDDTTGQVSGVFVPGRPASAGAPGLLVYVMVDDMEATLKAVVAAGGTIVQPVGGDAPEITARVADPAGNVIGLYQPS